MQRCEALVVFLQSEKELYQDVVVFIFSQDMTDERFEEGCFPAICEALGILSRLLNYQRLMGARDYQCFGANDDCWG